MNKTDCVIFKSDTFAPGGNVQVSNVIAEVNLPNCTPHSPPAVSESGIYFNPELQNYTGPIQIGNVRVRDAKYSILGGSSTGTVGADIQISNVDIDGAGGSTEWAIFMANLGNFPRLSFGNVNIKNVKNAVYIRYGDGNSSGNAQTTIDSLKITQSSSIGVLTDGYAKLKVGSVDMFGVQTAYYQGDDSSLKIGSESLIGVTTKFGKNPCALSEGWSNYGGDNSKFDIVYSGYEVKLKGLILAGVGVTGNILNLPEYLRPTESIRLIAYKNAGGVGGTCLIGVSSSGIISIDDGIAPPVGTFISLDGISWKLKGEIWP
jgi:hypothetical protein